MAFLAGGAIYAQDLTTAAMAGRVTNQNGQPLQGVRVQLESPSMLGSRQIVTDSNGQFRVSLLPNGVYSVTYSLNNYLTRKLSLRITAGQVANANITLTEIAARVETVEITTASTVIAQIDKTDTIVQTSYSADFLEILSGRSFNNLGRLASGINKADVADPNGGVHIRGGTGRSTRTIVNGATIDNMISQEIILSMLPVGDLIESVAIIQSPLNARYGNSDGGLISAVTARGGNTFSGTVRWNIDRPVGWSARDEGTGYPYRDPNYVGGTATVNPGNENYTKNMDFSLTGPIWKDHITFSYGTRLTPTSYSTPSTSWESYIGSPNDPQPYNRMGTYFVQNNPALPGYGDVIRKAELYSNSEYYTTRNRISQQTYNQFSVYWQVLPQHQVEWGYLQSDELIDNAGRSATNGSAPLGEIGPWDTVDTNRRSWNVAYRGIIGNGVLETRYSSAYFWWGTGVRGGVTPPPIRTFTIGSYRPMNNGYGTPGSNEANYWASGYLGAALSTSNIDLYDRTGGATPPTANTGWAWMYSNGLISMAPGDGGTTDQLVLNYQYHLNTNKGSHLIDVGVQRDMTAWKLRANTNILNFNAMGHISRNLGPGDIYNPSGTTGSYLDYRDRYIVFNVAQARYSDIDPWAVNYYGLTDKYILNRQTGMFERPFADANSYGQPGDNVFPGANTPLPYVYTRYGDANGDINANNTTFYINDLWSINDNHSVMAGLRVDNYDVSNNLQDLHSYTLPTLRFDYKWDIHGDQRRLLNVSWGQFHTFQGMGPFTAMTPRPGDFREIRYWNKGSGQPYLVTKEDLLDLNNYDDGSNPWNLKQQFGNANYRVDPDWKAMVSTEFTVGMTRNLSIGGFWKATFVYRTWANEWAYLPGEVITDSVTGNKTFVRVLKNDDSYERKYTGLELEWEVPLHKRVIFLGSYTYNRFMRNSPVSVDDSAYWQLEGTGNISWDQWRDKMMGSREVHNPVRLYQPEHYLKLFLTFDMSTGNVKSNLTLNGQFTSASPINYGYTTGLGFPYDLYPELISSTAGATIPGTSGSSAMTNSATEYRNLGLSHNDSWSVFLRYLITVPIYKKLAWMATIHIDNPFNHRGLGGGWMGSNDSGFIIYREVPDLWPANDQSNGRHWRSNGDLNGYYRDRQSPRAIYMNTGIRF
jgi:hypothetical protein